MLRLDLSYADLGLPAVRDLTRRASVSGVQDKVQLRRVRGGYRVVARGGDYILKPVPRNTSARLARDIPANEDLTMTIAHRLFRIRTAEHALVELADGEPAYMTRRFDFRDGLKIRQEDFCQLLERSEETHGDNYKYGASYEELAACLRRHCPAAVVEGPKLFFQIVFNYAVGNGDAHLKNFSLQDSEQGDLVLTPAYDLLNTSVHFPSEPSAAGLDFFADGRFTSRYEDLGFYSSADFIELGRCFGVDEGEVRAMLRRFPAQRDGVLAAVAASALSPEAQASYCGKFLDRLKALAQ